jgi:hypothetical protein
MSGGSYKYLHSKDAESLLTNSDYADELKFMAARLADFGDAGQGARALALEIHQDVENLRAQLEAQLEKIDAKMVRASAVFRSVEWCDSLDCTEVRVRESLEAFNDSIVTA